MQEPPALERNHPEKIPYVFKNVKQGLFDYESEKKDCIQYTRHVYFKMKDASVGFVLSLTIIKLAQQIQELIL